MIKNKTATYDGGKKPPLHRLIALGVILFLSADCTTLLAQQQFSYTQYIDNLTPIIPAWSLTRQSAEVNILGRKQWVGIEGAPATYMVNAFATLQTINATAGIFVMNDQVAVENLTEANGFFAKAVQLDDQTFLSVSINGGFRRYNAPYSTLDPTDPILQAGDVYETEGNVGASVMVFTANKFYAGVSMPRLSFQDLGAGSVASSRNFKNFYYLTAGYGHQLSDDIELSSSALMAYTQNVPLQGDLTVKASFKKLIALGVNYRTSNEIAALTSFNVSKLRFGYSYLTGFGTTKLSGISQGTHEITLGFILGRSGSYSDSGNEKYWSY